MSCRELERLFVDGASEAQWRAHAGTCRACVDAVQVLEEIPSLAASLSRPSGSPSLHEKLLAIPGRAIACQTADEWLAKQIEGDLPASERQRLADHLTRCGGCAASAEALDGLAHLARPEAAPWVAGRIAANLRERSRGKRAKGWPAWLRNPRAAIAVAYAAAVVLMIAGFNPADLARRADPARLSQAAGSAVAEVKISAVDRIGAFEERAMRSFAAWRGRAGGYGRAALAQAIQLVMKSEPPPSPRRPRSGEERGALPKYEIEMTTWRA